MGHFAHSIHREPDESRVALLQRFKQFDCFPEFENAPFFSEQPDSRRQSHIRDGAVSEGALQRFSRPGERFRRFG